MPKSTNPGPMRILSAQDIDLRIKRLAIEILECNIEEPRLVLAGINNNGLHFARLLQQSLEKRAPMPIELTRIRLNPANPLEKPAQLETDPQKLHQATVIVVDDVANTGRTLFYACQTLMSILPKSVQIAVLVDRTHKTFPIQADFVGLALATTLQEHIHVHLGQSEEKSEGIGVFLR